MKKISLLVLVFALIFVLTACGGNDLSNTNNTNINSSSNEEVLLNKLSFEEGGNQLVELSEKLMNGEVSSEEAKKIKEEIKNNMETREEFLAKTNDNISMFTEMPTWAKELKIEEPEGLNLITSKSNIITAKGAYSNTFNITYSGDKNIMMSEAKRISEKLNLGIDNDDTNLFMSSGEVGKYTVSITVSDNGEGFEMLYSATDLSKIAR